MSALLEFVETIEKAGGVYINDTDGFELWCPVGDPTWTDLGDAYKLACQELGRTPKIISEDDL